MSIEAMNQMVMALEVEYRMYEATDPETGAPYNMIQAINAGRQAIAEASQNGLYREGYRNGYAFGEAAGKRQAIVEAEKQEPVGVVDSTISGHIDWLCTFFPKQGTKLYTHPQPKEKP